MTTSQEKLITLEQAYNFFKTYLKKVASRNCTWKQMRTYMETIEEPDERIEELMKIMIALLFFYQDYSHKIEKLRQEVYTTFSAELQELFHFSQPIPPQKVKIPVKDMDKFCEVLLRWYDEKVIQIKDFNTWVDELYSLFYIPYSLKYFRNDMNEMYEDYIKTGKLTSFSEFRKRKKLEKDEKQVNENKEDIENKNIN